jgi:hypothetical protein
MLGKPAQPPSFRVPSSMSMASSGLSKINHGSSMSMARQSNTILGAMHTSSNRVQRSKALMVMNAEPKGNSSDSQPVRYGWGSLSDDSINVSTRRDSVVLEASA